MSILCLFYEHMSTILKMNFVIITQKGITMAREKNVRKLNFKPIVSSFVPKDGEYNGISLLLHEEIEAIYLMDVLNLYQEDAAKSMEISRTTFTRILKNARQKVANALIGGYKIDIEDTKEDTIIAFCSDNTEEFNNISPLEKYILIYQVKNDNVTLVTSIQNPAFDKKLKPATVLPEILVKNRVNMFISSKIGEGLKNSLISKGIKPINKKEIADINSLKEISEY